MRILGTSLPSGPGMYIVNTRVSSSLYCVTALTFIGLPSGPGMSSMPVAVFEAASYVLSVTAMLVDPFSFPAAPFLDRLNADRPGLPLVGGLAVGGPGPSAQALLLDGELVEGGAVGVAISGVPVQTVVSQGCAPIGRDAVITSAEENVVYELAGERPVDRLRNEIMALTRGDD